VALPLDVDLPDEAATAALAARVAPLAVAGDVIALRGPLGSGKTTLARAFIRARGAGDEEVPSPTFTLVEVYAPPQGPVIWHFDLYRLEAPEDAWELGIEEAFAEGISLIEWPERLGALLPAERLDIALAENSGRRARITGGKRWAERLAHV
jgi:tRNA threonylcarbamoyladenosine biosynthesis protein TsaE